MDEEFERRWYKENTQEPYQVKYPIIDYLYEDIDDETLANEEATIAKMHKEFIEKAAQEKGQPVEKHYTEITDKAVFKK